MKLMELKYWLPVRDVTEPELIILIKYIYYDLRKNKKSR